MKKRILLYTASIAFALISCEENDKPAGNSNDNTNDNLPVENIDPLDDPTYYDNDPNCGTPGQSGNCCDVDGRILVRPNYSYTYTYDGTNNGNTTLTRIEWKVVNGDITLIGGQNTTQAKFKFGADFTTGKITATGLVNGNGCQNTLEVSKL